MRRRLARASRARQVAVLSYLPEIILPTSKKIVESDQIFLFKFGCFVSKKMQPYFDPLRMRRRFLLTGSTK